MFRVQLFSYFVLFTDDGAGMKAESVRGTTPPLCHVTILVEIPGTLYLAVGLLQLGRLSFPQRSGELEQ